MGYKPQDEAFARACERAQRGKPMSEQDELTDFLYESLKEIEVEENVRLSDRAFIADCLAPKVKQHYVKWDREKVAEYLEGKEFFINWDNNLKCADQLKEILEANQ